MWVMPKLVKDIFDQRKYGYASFRGKFLWKLVLVAALWSFWIERNNRTFKGSNKHHMAVVDSIFSEVAFWAVRCKEFHCYDVDSILRSWDAMM